MPEALVEDQTELLSQPAFSGLLQNIFPNGLIQYDGRVGAPEDFPLTAAELAEVQAPGLPIASAPSPDYVAFWDALLDSSLYGSIREQSMVSLPMNTLATELIALLGDAKAGRPNEVAIQQAIAAILTAGTFTEQQLGELQAALVAGNLQDLYTLSNN
jgi:hypothetical protein